MAILSAGVPLFGCESAVASRSGTSELVDRNLMPYFGRDSYLAKFPIDFSPRLPKRVLREDEHHRIFTDSHGLTVTVLKDLAAIPQVMEYPIKSRKDSCEYISGYDQDYDKRLPGDPNTPREELKDWQYPMRPGVGPFGFSFFARSLMGEVGYRTALCDAPAHPRVQRVLSPLRRRVVVADPRGGRRRLRDDS